MLKACHYFLFFIKLENFQKNLKLKKRKTGKLFIEILNNFNILTAQI